MANTAPASLSHVCGTIFRPWIWNWVEISPNWPPRAKSRSLGPKLTRMDRQQGGKLPIFRLILGLLFTIFEPGRGKKGQTWLKIALDCNQHNSTPLERYLGRKHPKNFLQMPKTNLLELHSPEVWRTTSLGNKFGPWWPQTGLLGQNPNSPKSQKSQLEIYNISGIVQSRFGWKMSVNGCPVPCIAPTSPKSEQNLNNLTNNLKPASWGITWTTLSKILQNVIPKIAFSAPQKRLNRIEHIFNK